MSSPIRRLVDVVLETERCNVIQDQELLLRAIIPGSSPLVELFELDDTLALLILKDDFELDELAAVEGEHVPLLPGSPYLRGLLRHCSSSGYVADIATTQRAPAPPVEEVLGAVRAVAPWLELDQPPAPEPANHRVLTFHFLITLQTIEQARILKTVALDLETGHSLDPPHLEDLRNAQSTVISLRSGELASAWRYAAGRAASEACALAALYEEQHQEQAETAAQQVEEARRESMARTAAATWAWSGASGDAEELAAHWQRRTEQALNRFRAQGATVALVSATRELRPFLEYELRYGYGAASDSGQRWLFDMTHGRLLAPLCGGAESLRELATDHAGPACRQSIVAFYECGHSMCADCSAFCTLCDLYACSDCSVCCAICEERCCRSHVASCPTCSIPVCTHHAEVCCLCDEPCCERCANRCPNCEATYCRNHAIACADCSLTMPCSKCQVGDGHKPPTSSQLEFELCSACQKPLCEECAKLCHRCDRIACSAHSFTCETCDEANCLEHAHRCETCDKRVCPDCDRCLSCDSSVCTDCWETCEYCGEYTCQACSRSCQNCGNLRCNSCTGEACRDPACTTVLCHNDNCYLCCEVCGGRFCQQHASSCQACGSLTCTAHQIRCAGCDIRTCLECGPCTDCDETFYADEGLASDVQGRSPNESEEGTVPWAPCPACGKPASFTLPCRKCHCLGCRACLARCADCRELYCENDRQHCAECNRDICMRCVNRHIEEEYGLAVLPDL